MLSKQVENEKCTLRKPKNVTTTALTRAVLNSSGSMYIARNHAIQVPFQLQTKTK